MQKTEEEESFLELDDTAEFYLTELSHDLPQEAVQDGQLPAQVDVALEPAGVADAVQVGDLVEELLHGAPLHL